MRIACLFVVLAVGCSVVKQHRSEVLRKTEECGAGDLTGTSAASVQDWFSRHRACGVAVNDLCRKIRQSAPARWADSTEGRICTAATSVAEWAPNPNTDHEQFQAGWK
jgi:hypothetical protein